VGLTQTPCLRLVMRRSAVGDDRRLRTKVSNTASADTCTHMDSPGRSYAGARLRPGGRASLIRQRSKPNLHVGSSRLYLADGKGRRYAAPLMPCSRADKPLQAFRDVSQVAANGQLDGAPSGSHVGTQFSITTTVC
jgi:hypothetical protein